MAKTKNFDTGGQVRPDVFLRFGGAGAGLDFQPDESVKAAQGRLEDWFKEETTVDPQTLFGGIAALLNLEKGKTVESPSFELGEDITARARLGLNPEDSYMPSHLGGQANFEDVFGEDFDLGAKADWKKDGGFDVGLQGTLRFHQGGVIDAPEYPAYKNSEVQSLPFPEGWQPYKSPPGQTTNWPMPVTKIELIGDSNQESPDGPLQSFPPAEPIARDAAWIEGRDWYRGPGGEEISMFRGPPPSQAGISEEKLRHLQTLNPNPHLGPEQPYAYTDTPNPDIKLPGFTSSLPPWGSFMAQGGLVPQITRPEIYGRGEDSMMMHVTPGEVQGLMSLFPGALTQNPYTGYPEAGGFGDFFKKVLPILAVAAITYVTMGAGTAPALAATGGGAAAGGAATTGAASMAALQAGTGAAGVASGLGAGLGAGTIYGAGASAIPMAAGLGGGWMGAGGAKTASMLGSQALGSMGSLGGAQAMGYQGGTYGMSPGGMGGISSYGTPGSGGLSGYTGTGMGEPQVKGIDWGDTAKRLAKQAGQQEEEEPPPPPPMPTATVEQGRPAVSMDELLASIPSGQLPERETGGLGLELEDVTDDDLIDKLLEEEEEEGITDDELADLLMPGFRKGGPVEGMMVGPSSIIPQGGGLVLGGEMDGDVFKVDGVHTQIYDGGEAVQEARLNNGEVVMSAGAVTGLGKALGASPNEEIQAGADFLMQIQQRGEAMNNGDHKSPTNLRPSYGFGLA